MAAFPRDARDALVAAVAGLSELREIELSENIEDVLGCLATGRIQMAGQLEEARWQPTAAARHLQWAPVGRTRLEAALLGVSDEMLDARPIPGEWSIRQQLAHVELTYERYTIACVYTAERSDDDPIRPPPSSYPERKGSPEGNPREPLREIIARHRDVWDRAIEPLFIISEDKLQRATEWHNAEHTLAFRLHRFGAHDLEIATDLSATADALGVRRTPSIWWAMALLEDWGETEALSLGVPDDVAERSGVNAAMAGWRDADLKAASAFAGS